MSLESNKVQISNGVFLAFIINLVYTKGIGLTQGILARQVGNDMWIATLIGVLKGAVVMLLVVWLIRKLPEKNIIEHAEILLGKWGGMVIGILMALFFLGAYASVMVTYVYHIKDYFAPEAPILLPIVVAVIVGLYAVFKGLEVIGRFALIGIFSVMLFNGFMILGSFNQFDILELLPVLSAGFMEDVRASIHYDAEWAMTTMMALMILPRVKDKQTWYKSGLLGTFAAGIIVLLWPILEAGVLSPEVTSQYIVACMQLARGASIGLFLHRYEMIMVALFAISLYTQIMLFIFLTSLTIQQTFKLKKMRPIYIPVTLALNGFGYWVIFDHSRAMTLLTYYWPQIAVSFAVGIPGVIALISFFFKSKYRTG